MKGLEFLKRKSRQNEEPSVDECVYECINIADYYNRFVTKFMRLHYPFDNRRELQEHVDCFKEALEEQEFNLEDGLHYDDAKDAGYAVLELVRAIIREYVIGNPEELEECGCCNCLKEYSVNEEHCGCEDYHVCGSTRCMSYGAETVCCGNEISEELIALEKKIVITLFYLKQEFPSLSYHKIMSEVIQGCDWEPKIPWSFDVFGEVIDYAMVDYLDVEDIERVWEDCFDTLMGYADKGSILVLKRGCYPTPTIQRDEEWVKKLYEFLAKGNLLACCPCLLIGDILDIFPEMSNMVLEGIFEGLLCGEYTDITVADLLRVMAEYQNHRNNYFSCCYKRYKEVIAMVMNNQQVATMGLELNEVAEILVDTFKVPNEDVEDTIQSMALDLLGCTKEYNYTLLPENQFKLVYLLTNKVVYDIVEEYNPYIIAQFM